MMIKPAVDLDKALRYLQDSRDALGAAVEGLSEEQCREKSKLEVWSIAEIAEHLAIVEQGFLSRAAVSLPDAPPPGDDFDAEAGDARVLAAGRDRSLKIEAPERIRPSGAVALADSLERFRARREQTIAFFQSATELREHAVPHPFFGPLDGYQWALLMSSHTERHVNQIIDIRSAWQ